jgi:hypothetical protein
VTGGSSRIVMMGIEDGMGMVVRVGGGRDERGTTLVMMVSVEDGMKSQCMELLIGKSTTKASHNFLPDMVPSSRIDGNDSGIFLGNVSSSPSSTSSSEPEGCPLSL